MGAGRRYIGGRHLHVRLGLLAATATATVLAGTAYLTIRFFRTQVLAAVAEESSSQSDALRVVLEEQMIAGDRKVLRRLVSDIGGEPGIDWIAVLDRQGHVQVSSKDAALGLVFDVRSPDCRICHEHAPAERLHSVTIVRAGESLLRTVTPIGNREPCRRCHGSDHRLNGVLIVDRSLGPAQAAVAASRRGVLLGTAAALLALLTSLGFATERLVLARLRRLREATRRLGQGDFGARAAARSPDELGDLGRDFNAMAERLAAAMTGVAMERQRLEELVNGITDGVVVVDGDLRIAMTNRAFIARLGPGQSARAGASYREVARAAGVREVESPAERALASGRLEQQIVRVSAAGGDRSEEIYAHPLRNAQGEVTSVVEVWRDVTDRMALEAGLEQSERLAAIGVLASAVAHEVGNPLASIATAVEGVLRRLGRPGEVGPDELRDYLQIVQKQVFRCREVTQRLLGFARVPSLQATVVDAAAAAAEVVALVAPQARSQRVEVRTDLGRAVPAAAESMLVEQVVLNLMLNALHAMPDGGVLTVSAGQHDGAATVVVADTGPGIPDAVRAHLFEPFRRARADGGGTGLGLFLSHTLVRRCGGRIDVESEPGRGSVFTVRLESASEPPAAGHDAAAPGLGREEGSR